MSGENSLNYLPELTPFSEERVLIDLFLNLSHVCSIQEFVLNTVNMKYIDRYRERRERDRQTDRDRERETERQRETERDRDRERQRETESERELVLELLNSRIVALGLFGPI